MHKENRLLRTANQQRDIVQAKDMYEILVHHDVDGEQNPETTYITSRWSGEERVPSGELHISVIISCETSSTSEQMILNSVEDSITIEISMDLHYDITHLSDSGNRVLARITPLECHKICWQSSLVAQVDTMCFISDMSSECHIIDPITYITSLREMKRYTVKQRLSGFELIVETELSGDTEKAFIVLSIFNLAKNSSETLSKKFSTDSSNGTFSVPLSSDTVYAVEYKYIKVKPFHFSTKKHFLIEISLGNNSEPSYPLVEVEFHMGNDTRTESGFIPSSHVTFTRSELYSDREIHLHLEPFCSEMQNTTWIFSDQKTSHHVDVTPAICSQTNEPKFCQYENYTKCSSYLCYSTSVVINDNEYSGDVRCFDFTQQLPINSNSNRLPTFTYLLTALFLVISIHVE
ncbi:hypothetical protein DICVIV_08590 [Dictyocaulus viviparus]|uniref:Uncharacterized protein n=1 Tax=Dictyocaulus viviparus TaxID=29172 RepID=A0A0D8XNQ8_DICVI|nr:hypothetical protein DICVIV_08590 [Dictyocaulus viviparus]